jgi:hypothetical protein
VSSWSLVFLGVIALATLAIAIVQVGVLVAAGRLARRLDALADQMDRELKPLFGHLNAIGREASRASTLATAQVERADQLFSDVAGRIEQGLNSLQASLVAPAREGRALLIAFRAAFQALREFRLRARSGQTRAEEEDALFI